MNKKYPVMFLALGFFLGVSSANASEETHAQGQVAYVSASEHFLTLTRTNPVTGKKEKFDMLVPENAALKGVVSLDKLSLHETVKVDAKKDPISGNWEVQQLEVL